MILFSYLIWKVVVLLYVLLYVVLIVCFIKVIAVTCPVRLGESRASDGIDPF